MPWAGQWSVRFPPREKKKVFLFTRTSKPTLRHTQLPIPWVQNLV